MSGLIDSVEQIIDEIESWRVKYLRILDTALTKLSENGDQDSYDEAIGTLTAGVKGLILRPIMAEGWARCDREYFPDDENRKYVAAYSNYGTVLPGLSENQCLKGIIRMIEADPDCAGMVINPKQQNELFVRKALLLDILKTWEAEEEAENEVNDCSPDDEQDENDEENVIQGEDRTVQILITPPENVETFESMAKDIQRLAGANDDYYDILVDMEHDLPYSIHLSGGDKIRMEILSFSKPVSGIAEHVRVFRYYKDLNVEDVVEAVRRICLYAEPESLNEHINLSFCGEFIENEEARRFFSLWNAIKEFEKTLYSIIKKRKEEQTE